MLKIAKESEEMMKEHDPAEDIEEITVKDQSYPSVYSYFELLPEHMRSNEIAQDGARGLEKYSYNVESIQDRIEILNEICESALPLDESKPNLTNSSY